MGKLTINLARPYNLLYNLPTEARDRPQAIDSEVAQARGAGEGEAVKINTNTMWWRLLEEARTFFEQCN